MSTAQSQEEFRIADERTPLLSSVNANDAQETQLGGVVDERLQASGRQVALDLLRGLLMALMAIDHLSVSIKGYPHGQGVIGENASTIITEWNSPLGYFLRLMTHLCAPNFAMLLGVGIAYFVRSRLAQGMKPLAFIKHFSLRALAIVLVNFIAFPTLLLQHPPILVLNAVLWALAIDYLIIGGLSLAFVFIIEPALINSLKKLLFSRQVSLSQSKAETKATFITHNFINLLLLIASIVNLWGNIWTSTNHGDCKSAISTITTTVFFPPPDAVCKFNQNFFFRFFLQQVNCPQLHIISGFPPIGWLPFALFGFLYGRLLLQGHFRLTRSVISLNALLSIVFALLFISTRLLSYGNLTTHCLATPDQSDRPINANQYIASIQAFFYISKYPPSPAFAFFTLSIAFFLLVIFIALSNASISSTSVSNAMKSRLNPLIVYGNQPLFFYGTHLLLVQIIAFPILNSKLAKPLPDWSQTGKGVGLGFNFFAILVILWTIMYFACLLYARFKLSRGRESIWRFL